MIQHHPGSAIWAVPCPVMDIFLRKPNISHAVVVVVAEKKAVAIIVCQPVSKSCADRWATGPITAGQIVIGISEDDAPRLTACWSWSKKASFTSSSATLVGGLVLVLLCWWRKRADDSLSHRRVQLIKDLQRAFGGECEAIKAGPSLRATPDVTMVACFCFLVLPLSFAEPCQGDVIAAGLLGQQGGSSGAKECLSQLGWSGLST